MTLGNKCLRIKEKELNNSGRRKKWFENFFVIANIDFAHFVSILHVKWLKIVICNRFRASGSGLVWMRSDTTKRVD